MEALHPPSFPAPAPAAMQSSSRADVQQYDFATGAEVGNEEAVDLSFSHLPPYDPDVLCDFSIGVVGDDGDLFEQFTSLQRELDLLERRTEGVQIEIADLRREVKDMEMENEYEFESLATNTTALVAGHLVELVDDTHAVVSMTTDVSCPRLFYVSVLGTVDRDLLKPSANVALCTSSLALVDVLPADAGWAVPVVAAAGAEKPSVTYADVGGCEEQKREVLEALELPLTHPELFASVGVEPPRGVLLYGPPGTGKTMLAKAVAHHTSAAFIHVSGAEFVHRHPEEGPRMMREAFQAARENAPAIIFLDEVDAIAAARSDDANTGADREVHRVLLELLAQMDGFDQCPADVRVIMATNRADALDPALLRPGRLDRKVEFPLPGRRQKRLVYQACTARMSLDHDGAGDLLDDLAGRHDDMSAAEVDAVCREAGMRAVREHRCVVTREDLEEGYRAVAKDSDRSAAAFSFYS